MKNQRKTQNAFSFRTFSARRRGVAMVELAFVVTILLTLTLGLIQWGMIMNASIALTNLSREGARYAAVNWSGTGTDQAIKNYVLKDAPPGIRKEDLTIEISPPEGTVDRTGKNPITVTVSYNMKKKLFLPEKIFNATFFSGTYKSEGHMMMEPN